MNVVEILASVWPDLELQFVVRQKEFSTRYLVCSRTGNKQQFYLDILTFMNTTANYDQRVTAGNMQNFQGSDETTVLQPDSEGTTLLYHDSDETTLLQQTSGGMTLHPHDLQENTVDACLKRIDLLKRMSEDERNSLIRVYDYRSVMASNRSEKYVAILLEALPSLAQYLSKEASYDSETVSRMGADICHAVDLLGMNDFQQETVTPEDIYVDLRGRFKLGSYIYSMDAVRTHRVDQMSNRKVLYQSPEEIRHMQMDQRSLVYSIGMIMYEMGNRGCLPGSTQKTSQYSLMDIEQNVSLRLSGTAISLPSTLAPRVGSLIVRAISNEPLERFESLRVFYFALMQSGDKSPASSPVQSSLQPSSAQQSQQPPQQAGSQREKLIEAQRQQRQTAQQPLVQFTSATELKKGGYKDLSVAENERNHAKTEEPSVSERKNATSNMKQDIPEPDETDQVPAARMRSPIVPILVLMCAIMTSAAILITYMITKQLYSDRYMVPYEAVMAEKQAEEDKKAAEQSRKEVFYDSAVYVADVYKILVLRERAYLTAPIVRFLDAGTQLHIVGDGEGPMVEVKTDDGITGFVEKKYLTAKGAKTTRRGTRGPELAEENIYLIDRYDSAPVYTGMDENYAIVGYLPAGNPIQIISWGEFFAEMIDLQSGMIGCIPIGDVPINTWENLMIFMTGDSFTTAGFFKEASYPVNSDKVVYMRKAESMYSEAVAVLVPGQWVTLNSISEDGKYCYVTTQTEEAVSGYVLTEALYADPETSENGEKSQEERPDGAENGGE